MKIAELADGRQIHFPDETPDEVMDQQVAALMGGMQAPAPPMEQQLMPMLIQAMGGLMQEKTDYAKQCEAAAQMRHEEAEAGREADVKLRAAETADKVRALQDVGQEIFTLAEQVQPLSALLQDIAQSARSTPDLVKAVNNLSRTVSDMGQAIIRVLLTPRVISTDKDGTPKAIAPAGKAQSIEDLL